MEIINNTPFQVEAMPFKGPGGKPVLTIIVKGTFDITPDHPASVAMEQIPIFYGDEFYDKKRGGSVKFEYDLAPFKPRADIVLVGKAIASEGQMVQALDVMLRVGDVRKIIRVFGDRHWNRLSRMIAISSSDPIPFKNMDLVYERAFGGIDKNGGDWCQENPIGRGFYAQKSKKTLDNEPLPNLEDPANLITSWNDHPKPAGFGFYGRAWMPRAASIGTYDEKWHEERSPDQPEDFKFDYYNAAHPDLQVEGYLEGNEEVELINLSPEGNVHFQLPRTKANCFVTMYSADSYTEENLRSEEVNLNLDTVCLIPDEKRFYQVWRGLCPIQVLSAFEVKTVEIT